MFPLPKTLLALGLLLLPLTTAQGHPYPDLPVRGSFEAGGSATITVEIDPRCFVADPLDEPYLLNWVLGEMTEAEREDHRKQARALIEKSLEIRFEPGGAAVPEFKFTFTGHEGAALENRDDPVMITATWKTKLPENTRGYQLRAKPECRFGVIFRNVVHGKKVERIKVLFPKEESYVLDISNGKKLS